MPSLPQPDADTPSDPSPGHPGPALRAFWHAGPRHCAAPASAGMLRPVPRPPRARLALVPLLAAAALGSGCLSSSLRAVSGMVSHNLCCEVFVTGVPPERAYAESLAPRSGMGLVNWAVRYRVDADAEQVTSTIAGGFESRALHRPGRGCLLLQGEAPPAAAAPDAWTPTSLPEPAGPDVVEPGDERLRSALDRAFAEPDGGAERFTRAVVVAQDGRIVAERYAPGFGPETRFLGYSATKSVVSALVGILVREGRLAPDAPAPVAAWSDPADPRHAITVDQLLRMTSGLALAESGTPWSPVARMLYVERDMAGYAAAADLDAAPGTEWDYTSGGTVLLSAIVRDAAGGDALAFAQRELFGPLGMRSAVFELDATGTPLGSTYLLASARDWIRFGLLYLNDGMAGGRRILPEGWVARSIAPTLDTGYGAGFWTNRVPGDIPWTSAPWGIPGAPDDAYFARGLLGQYVVVVPSRRLVVVRLGASARTGGDMEGLAQLLSDVIGTLDAPH